MIETSPHKQPTSIVNAPDLVALLGNSYQGEWVALAPDYSTVWASARSVNALLAMLSEAQRAAQPVFYKVPAEGYYVPSLL